MDQVTRGTLTWPLENEARWVMMSLGETQHRVMVHAKLGFLFDDHAQLSPDTVSLEAKMTPRRSQCACHVVSLWWQGTLDWSQGICRPDLDNAMLWNMTVTFRLHEESISCKIVGTTLAMQFFNKVLRAVGVKRIAWARPR